MKIQYVLFALLILQAFSACKKSALDYVNEPKPAPGGANISNGNFLRRSHPTSGTVRLVTDIAGRRFLLFENFNTDNGPDLGYGFPPIPQPLLTRNWDR
ncbi:MAG: hypothetical protein SGI83_04300 [Bacteroidota bacterium]|nr:hypothetical protein [Bacteroidota bacterium]